MHLLYEKVSVPGHNWELFHESCAENEKQEKHGLVLNSYASRLLTAA